MEISRCCLQPSEAESTEKVELNSSEGSTGKGEVLTVRGNSD